MIYFIRNVRTGSYKIGHSASPAHRLAELQTGNEDELVLELTIPGGKRAERHLHAVCDSRRIRGEWFRGDAGLKRMVEQLRIGRMILEEFGKPAYSTLRWFLTEDVSNKWLDLWVRGLTGNDREKSNPG